VALREFDRASALWTASAIADVVIPVCEAALAHRRLTTHVSSIFWHRGAIRSGCSTAVMRSPIL